MDIISNKNKDLNIKFYSSNCDKFIKITNIDKEILSSNFIINQLGNQDENLFKIDIENKDNIKGSIYTILSTIFLTLIVIIHRYIFINNINISVNIQIFYKYCGYLSFSFIILKVKGINLESSNKFIKNNLKPFLIRMISGTLAGTFFILSLLYFNSIIVGIANCIVPILTTVIASFVIENQKFKRREIYILVILFISSYFIIVADSHEEHIEDNNHKNIDFNSSFFDLVKGTIIIIVFILSSTLRAVYSKVLYPVNLFYQLFFIGLFTIIPYFIICQILGYPLLINIPFNHILISYSIGIFEFCPVFLNLYALNIGDIPIMMQLNYLYLPILSIFSYLILGESMEILKVIFIVLIFAVTFCNSYYTNFIEKNN